MRRGRFLLLTAWLLWAGAARAQSTFYEWYRDGLRLEAAGELEAARQAFLQAARERPQAGRNVKTYGLNFLESYDPYLRLAAVEVRLGLLQDAERDLARAQRTRVSPTAELSRVEAQMAERKRAAAAVPTAVTTAPPPPAAEPTRTPPPAARPAPVEEATAPAVAVPVAPPPPAAPRPTRTPRGTRPSPPPVGAPGVAAPAAPTLSAPPVSPVLPRPAPADRAHEPAPLMGTALAVAAAASLLAAALYALRRKSRQRTPEPGTVLLEPDAMPTVPNSPAPVSRDVSPLPADGTAVIGGYRLEGVLGKGGMGTTYAARRLRDGLPAALKVPHTRVLEDPEFAQRFLREAALGAALHHPNIIRIYETGEENGRPYFAMERLAGETLEARLSRGPLPVREALEVARGIALALDYAHLKGIVHRDLKPSNVMLLPDGSMKVMDYGVARLMRSPQLTGSLVFLGTPHYGAPEVALGDRVDQQADLYGLGIVLYRMLSGRLPFDAPTAFEILTLHCRAPLPPLPAALPEPVKALVLRLAAKDRQERYATAEAFLRDLNDVLNAL